MDQIDNLLARPRQYNNIDGVGELGMGVMFLGFAFLGWAQALTPAGAVWHLAPFQAVYIGAMVAILHFGTKAIKNRITYVRTGFVEYRATLHIWAGIAAALVAVVWGLLLHVFAKQQWNAASLASLWAVALAVGYGVQAGRTAQWKWAVVAAMMACSVTLAWIPADALGLGSGDVRSNGLARFAAIYLPTMAAYGLLWLISGGISFWLYLRHTRPAAAENQE